ncbi:MAG: PilZ domain-containing protein [Calditrichaceae bacterium]|nr:PilZ domain-containing protein [Calditrichaceae bacterium]MBN2709169.1 PilZ domain-containing protein [Calditrichaceae bacterium]RQV96125.1 MAG: PilZ domain-containing protein [Calditrichota bacterium]
MSFEGRGAQRVEGENLLAFRVLDNEDQVIKEGIVKTLDISRTGIAIEATTSMEAGQKVELTIGFGDDVVKARGSVQNTKEIGDKKYQIGIQFDFLSEDDLSKIGMAYPSVLK